MQNQILKSGFEELGLGYTDEIENKFNIDDTRIRNIENKSIP